MPTRKGKKPPPGTEVIKIRIPTEIKNECLTAKAAGVYREDAESTFFGHLLKIGLRRYQEYILPIEKGKNAPAILPSEKSNDEALNFFTSGSVIDGMGSPLRIEAHNMVRGIPTEKLGEVTDAIKAIRDGAGEKTG